MVRQVLFIQGAGEGVHDCWDSKLVASLERELGEGYSVRYPRMPREENPSYSVWKAPLLQEFDLLPAGAILVGHSFGGTTMLQALAEAPPKQRFAGLFVIAAPFVGEGGWPSDEIDCGNASGRLPHDLFIYLYHGLDDTDVPVAHVHHYAKTIPQACIRTLECKDHQFNNDLSDIAKDIRSIG